MKHMMAPALLTLMIATLSGCGENSDDGGLVGTTMQNIARNALPGAEITRKECGTCHYLDKSVRKVGPSLKGIMGQAPRTKGIPVEVWNEVSMDAWIESPTDVHPKTRMKIPGIKDAEKRAMIIEYLKTL